RRRHCSPFPSSMPLSLLSRPWRTKSESCIMSCAMDEGRKRVLAIVAGILVARHLKTTDDLLDSKGSPRTESMVAAAVQWAERIMRMVDNLVGSSDSRGAKGT